MKLQLDRVVLGFWEHPYSRLVHFLLWFSPAYFSDVRLLVRLCIEAATEGWMQDKGAAIMQAENTSDSFDADRNNGEV